jgi:hypothetical protein
MMAGEQSEARPQGEARRIKAYDPTAKGRQYSFSDDEEETPLLHLPAANTSFKPRRDILADATCCVSFVCPQTISATHKLSLPTCCVFCVSGRGQVLAPASNCYSKWACA